MGKSSKFFAGALLGAAAAVLLTPVTGKRARSKVKKVAEDSGVDTKALERKAKELGNKGKKFAKHVGEEAKKHAAKHKSKNK